MPIPTDSLSSKIYRVMEAEITRIVEEEAEAAAKRVQARVRGMTGQIAARCLEHYTFERLGNQLVIRVDFDHLNPNKA